MIAAAPQLDEKNLLLKNKILPLDEADGWEIS